jgi:hypothetical protein
MNGIMVKIKRLNKSESLPITGLRRNSLHYKLISYINNSICLLISESYDNVALFIKRAEAEISFLTQENLRHEEYFALCDDYMKSVSKYMITNNFLTEIGFDMLPQKYQNDEYLDDNSLNSLGMI